jgi:hypothetical protein
MKISRFLSLACAFSLLGSLFPVSAVAQIEIPQAQVTSSFSYLNTAKNSIDQRGFEISSGYNWLKWLTLGADFCRYSGGGTLPAPVARLPSNVSVPFNVNTYTVAVGTKFLLRKSKWVVPFVRPGLGLVHESTITTLPIIVPPQTKAEYRMFYGAGGGFEIYHVVPHASIIVLSDYLRTRLFAQDLNSYRISAGLSYLIGSKRVN